jgi:hypothetical protein
MTIDTLHTTISAIFRNGFHGLSTPNLALTLVTAKTAASIEIQIAMATGRNETGRIGTGRITMSGGTT